MFQGWDQSRKNRDCSQLSTSKRKEVEETLLSTFPVSSYSFYALPDSKLIQCLVEDFTPAKTVAAETPLPPPFFLCSRHWCCRT
mmetsp:Transcript_14170/g.28253  ORF Transcript_14170/g.28253 Transcript_14170/m.28253 type:complete len:84 (+) Transcript_14170:361-612(+)